MDHQHHQKWFLPLFYDVHNDRLRRDLDKAEDLGDISTLFTNVVQEYATHHTLSLFVDQFFTTVRR